MQWREPTFVCFDCGCSHRPGNYIVVKDEIWERFGHRTSYRQNGHGCKDRTITEQARHDGYLCFDCLESRMGRELTIDDLNQKALINLQWVRFLILRKLVKNQIIPDISITKDGKEFNNAYSTNHQSCRVRS